MKISRCARIGAVAVLATLVLSGTAWATPSIISAGPFDFVPCPSEYNDNFTDVLRGAEIDSGFDLGNTGHCAVNFTGSAGSAGDTWLTRFDDAPPNAFNAFQGLCMRADVLINHFT